MRGNAPYNGDGKPILDSFLGIWGAVFGRRMYAKRTTGPETARRHERLRGPRCEDCDRRDRRYQEHDPSAPSQAARERRARAENLTARERSEIAKKASDARWER